MSRVSLVRCPSYDEALVTSALDRALEPFGGISGVGGFGGKIGPGSRVLVKPNFLRAAPAERAVSPHPTLVRALCQRLLDLGASVRIGDSPAFGSAAGVAKANGIQRVAEELGVKIVEFRRPVQIRAQGPSPLQLQLDREVVEADAVINLCKLKNHQQTGMTGAVKNLFGCITGKRKPVWHLRLGDRDNDFAEMLLAVYRTVGPVVSICDGILAMEGNGPGEGDPRLLGVLLAAEDGVALDAICAAIVGHPIDQLGVLRAAASAGLGCPDPTEIEIVGDCVVADVVVSDWKRAEALPIFFNPARVAWSTAKQVGLMARMRVEGRRRSSRP